MPKTSSLVVAAAAAAVASAAPMRLSLRLGTNFWGLLSKSGYTSFQAILEFMDNSISNKIRATMVNLQIDWARGTAYIEDNGIGFPILLDALRRALELGGRDPSDLNEHGQGAKAALAAQDPSNSKWRIVWKVDGVIREIRAPYTDELDVHIIETWPGQMNQHPHGAYIEFPIDKKRFVELYSSKKAKCENPDPYIKEALSQVWMLHDRVSSGAVRLHFNGEHIEPFRRNTISDYEESSNRKSSSLSTGANVEMSQFMLKDSVPNSWFKRSGDAIGYYFFKNGRYIEHINEGARYAQLYGNKRHNDHIGFIVIINVTGTQDQLPYTTPTKIHFPESNLRSELYEIIKQNIKVEEPIDKSEESLVCQFIQMRKDNFSDLLDFDIKPKVKESFEVDGHVPCLSPQLDIVEWRSDKILVYEAKKDNAIRLDAVRQLFGNWKAAQAVWQGKRIVPVLMIERDDRLTLPSWLAPHLVAWDNMPLVVMNYGGRVLFGTP